MADFDTPQFDASEGDDQDRAETLDETNLTDDGEDIANFDDIPDVYDATTAEGDDDDDDDDDDERDDEGLDIEQEPLDAHVAEDDETA